MTAPILGPTGCTNPTYGFSADANAGLCITGADSLVVLSGAIGSANHSQWLSAATGSEFYFYGAGITANGFSANDGHAFAYIAGAQTMDISATIAAFPGASSGLTVGSVGIDQLRVLPQAAGAGAFGGTFTSSDLTVARTWTLPDATGDVAVIASTGFPVRTGAQAWSTRCLAAGTGVTISEACGQAGNITVGVDTAVVPQYSSGTGDVPATGAVGTFYSETDANSFYTYPSTDTEHWLLSIAAGQTAGRLFQTSATDVLAEITPTDETVLVSNGSTWEKKTLPDCDDTGGNHLNYDTGTNVFSCGTSGGSSSFDPTTLTFYEDFLSGGVSGAAVTGGLGLYEQANVGTTASVAGAQEHPGIIRINSHASTDNSGYAFYVNNNSSPASNGATNMLILANNDWDARASFLPGSNGTSVAAIDFSFGFNDSPYGHAGTNSYCIWIRYDTDLSDATYIFQVGNASGGAGCGSAADAANTKVEASTVAPASGTWNKFLIRRRASGVGGNPTIYMSVDGETEKTFCSSGCSDTLGTLHTTATVGTLTIGYYTRTTTGVMSGDLDYLYMNITGLSR
jgi:hypothetical protein